MLVVVEGSHDIQFLINMAAVLRRDGPGVLIRFAVNPRCKPRFMLTEGEPATLYDPAGGQAPALYTPGKLAFPKGVFEPVARLRIVIPDAEEDLTHEIALPNAATLARVTTAPDLR